MLGHRRNGGSLPEDREAFILADLGTGEWIDVYADLRLQTDAISCLAVLVTPSRAQALLESRHSLYSLHRFTPTWSEWRNIEGRHIGYQRFGDSHGLEPLVFIRNARYGESRSTVELSEEFRLFYDLHPDGAKGEYAQIADDGTRRVVARILDDVVEVHRAFLLHYLAVRGMHLAIHFVLTREHLQPLEGKDPGVSTDSVIEYLFFGREVKHSRLSNLAYVVTLPWRSEALTLPPWRDSYETRSEIQGVKILEAPSLDQVGLYVHDDIYSAFIVGHDDTDPLLYTCNPTELTLDPDLKLYRNSDTDSPDEGIVVPWPMVPFETSVYFTRDVLLKYESNQEAYRIYRSWSTKFPNCSETVEVTYKDLSRTLWRIEFGLLDAPQQDAVVLRIGSIGEHLPLSEQVYLKAFNVASPVSQINTLDNGILLRRPSHGREEEDFERTYALLLSEWKSKFTWSLFKPDDETCLFYVQLLSRPNEEQSNFDRQLCLLGKVLIGMLNTEQLHLPIEEEARTKASPLGLLQAYLIRSGVHDSEEHIFHLAQLLTYCQMINSSISTLQWHRSTVEFSDIAARFQSSAGTYSDLYISILVRCTAFLHFLTAKMPFMLSVD